MSWQAHWTGHYAGASTVSTKFQRFVYKETIPTPDRPHPPASSPSSILSSSRTLPNAIPPQVSSAPTTLPASSPRKRKRTSSGYCPPSKYAHITNHLTDSLAPNLICIFIGVNPGLRTATTGHAYAHPSNLFWKLAYKSGCTPRLCKAEEDGDLPHLYALGHTNIVIRPTRYASELSAAEMAEGVSVLEEKVRRYRPEYVCLVGKSIWETVWRVRHGKKIKRDEFRYGWQDLGESMGIETATKRDGWDGARVFVATSTSGLAAGMRPQEKETIWRDLGDFVEKRRKERGIPDTGGKKTEVLECID